ncbi:MAG: hypothetical protein JWP45_638 [Mucilaginibacter sp.]|nr:hypothetical protein [Mucilaginibacter sp.]
MPNAIDDQILTLSVQLKKEVAEYELESFAGFFTYFIKHRPVVEDGPLNDFYSKLKDYLYLIALNATAQSRGTKELVVNDSAIAKWAADLRQIKNLYQQNTVGDMESLDQSEESKQKVIHYMSFQTYFENGTLCYLEQDLDRLKRIFSPYDDQLLNDFGFDTEFLIILYRFSERVSAEKHRKANAFSETAEFAELMRSKDQGNWEERISKLPIPIQDALHQLMDCSHVSFKFSKEEYAAAFPQEKLEKFLELFTFNPVPDDKYLFFTQPNPLDDQPILLLPSGEYLYTYQKQLPIAIGKRLYQHLQQNEKLADKIRKHRDKTLELKTETIFRNFLGRDDRTFFYTNYHADLNTEQDLLILTRGMALIVEIKASKYREPFRDPVKGFERLKADFKDSIQYGYEQCLRIEDKFFEDAPFTIYDSNEKPLYQINPQKYEEIYSIVVTLERFGPIQSDLTLMLDKDETVDFPWAVYIDDLETFLLALKKTHHYPVLPFREFLRERSKFHGKAYVTDEMDVCGAFLSNPKLFKEIAANNDASATFLPDNQEIFDDLYYSGLGFEDELFIETKRKRKLRPGVKTQALKYNR